MIVFFVAKRVYFERMLDIIGFVAIFRGENRGKNGVRGLNFVRMQ
jgi:hypothetical protein